jgi:hypothetical protein
VSGGLIYQTALRRIRAHDLPDQAERDLVSALGAARSGPLDFVYLAGLDAGLPRDELLARGAAVFFIFAAGNLADDVSDGDCTYLPPRAAPGVQFMLQNLVFDTLLESSVPRSDLQAAAAELVRGAGQQQREIRTARWTFELAREVALGIAGGQYAAYLRLLWAGTPLSSGAASVGSDLGSAGHVALDITSNDPRVTTLSPADRHALVAWAREAVDRLRPLAHNSVQAGIMTVASVLDKEP